MDLFTNPFLDPVNFFATLITFRLFGTLMVYPFSSQPNHPYGQFFIQLTNSLFRFVSKGEHVDKRSLVWRISPEYVNLFVSSNENDERIENERCPCKRPYHWGDGFVWYLWHASKSKCVKFTTVQLFLRMSKMHSAGKNRENGKNCNVHCFPLNPENPSGPVRTAAGTKQKMSLVLPQKTQYAESKRSD